MAKAKPKTENAPETKTQKPSALADPALDAFGLGLAALQAKDWKKAVEHLEQAVEAADRSDLRDRALQLLNAARQKAGTGDKAAAKSPDADPFLAAVYEKNRGNLQAALDIAQQDGRDQQDERFAYLVASIHAAENRLDEAVQVLTKAIELNPKNRIHAFHDPDFAEIRKTQRHLFGLS
jgi:tetratricopeptide (TPR) repeat protein